MRALKRRAVGIIADRTHISEAEALDCLGRQSGTLTAFGLAADEQGRIIAAEVLRAIDRQTAQLVATREPAFDAPVQLHRVGSADWEVRLPWATIGSISAVSFHGEPLARPAAWLGVWIAEIERPDGTFIAFGAPSARAAQILAIRETSPQVVLPEWAANVRGLNNDQARAVQLVADAKAAGRDLPDEAALLTGWELEETTPIRNPADTAHRRALAITDDWDSAEDALADQHDVPTPAGLVLRTAGSTRQLERWSTKAVATKLQVQPSTVRSWHSRGQMPDPDGRDEAGKPWWTPATILDWDASRRGQDWRAKAWG